MNDSPACERACSVDEMNEASFPSLPLELDLPGVSCTRGRNLSAYSLFCIQGLAHLWTLYLVNTSADLGN